MPWTEEQGVCPRWCHNRQRIRTEDYLFMTDHPADDGDGRMGGRKEVVVMVVVFAAASTVSGPEIPTRKAPTRPSITYRLHRFRRTQFLHVLLPVVQSTHSRTSGLHGRSHMREEISESKIDTIFSSPVRLVLRQPKTDASICAAYGKWPSAWA